VVTGRNGRSGLEAVVWGLQERDQVIDAGGAGRGRGAEKLCR
jgi:hypothetical protein